MTKEEYKKLLIEMSWRGKFPAVGEKVDGMDAMCMYRTPDGKRCVAGVLIPDERYTPFLEGKTISSCIVRGAIVMPEGVTTEQLAALQELHDQFSRLPHWPIHAFNHIVEEILR